MAKRLISSALSAVIYIAHVRGWAIPAAGSLITARVIEPTTEQSVSRNFGPYPPHQLLPREVMLLGRESDGADSWKGRIIASGRGRCGGRGLKVNGVAARGSS